MKKIIFPLFGLGWLVVLTGCTLPLRGTQAPLPTLIMIPSPTALLFTPTTAAPTPTVPIPTVPTPTMSLPTLTPGALPTLTATQPIPGSTPTQIPGIVGGVPSGPYGVILVAPGDVLNVRTGAGAGYPVSGSFTPSANNIMRTGPSILADGDQWVQVQNPGGGTGWVNDHFLTEYVAPATFCTDSRVNTMLTNFGTALTTSNGPLLSAEVSPAHGVTVYLWRQGISHTFKQSDARWVFDSIYQHNWGPAPASGLDTVGSFHDKVLPWLQEVFNPSSSLTCNSLGTAAQFGSNPWPVEFTNINFYTVLKPGTPGVDLDFRYWLVGVEYFHGQPSIFALIHFAWEP